MIKNKCCQECGSLDLKTIIMPAEHTHYAKLVCPDCNDKFITWVKDPKNINKRTTNKNDGHKEQHRELEGQYKCKWCGADEIIYYNKAAHRYNFELDHVLPVSEGGKDEFFNTQILCKSCHNDKHHRRTLMNSLRKRLKEES